MARAKDTVSVTVDDETQREAEELAALNQSGGGELFAAIDELRGSAGASGVTCIVTRTAPQESAGYVGTLAVSECSREKIKSLYGSGKYMVQIKGPKGFLPGGGPVVIAPSLDQPTKGPSGDIFSVIEMLNKRDEERRKEAGEKTSRILEISIPVLGTVLTALLSRNTSPDMTALLTAMKPAPGPSLNDLTAALVNMKALSGGDKPATDPLESILKVMEAVKDLGGDNGGSGKGSTNWLDVAQTLIKEVGPAAKPLIEKAGEIIAQNRPVSVQPAVVPVPALTPPSESVPPPAVTPSVGIAENLPITGSPAGGTEVDQLTFFMPMIKMKLAKIAQWAAEDKNPETYAEVFIDELPSNIGNFIPHAKVMEYLNHPEWFKYVCEKEPHLQNFEKWCDEFRLEVIALLTLPTEEEENNAEA